jgi:hypothetical protein
MFDRIEDAISSRGIAFGDVKPDLHKIGARSRRSADRKRAIETHSAALRAASKARPSRLIRSNSSLASARNLGGQQQ